MSDTQKHLEDLEMRGDFIRRHIGSSSQQIEAMLAYLNLSSMDELTEKVIPESILTKQALSVTLDIQRARSNRLYAQNA